MTLKTIPKKLMRDLGFDQPLSPSTTLGYDLICEWLYPVYA
jgi:hypothetical protein